MGSCVSGASQDLRSLRELHSAEVPRKSATRLVREEGWAGLLLQSKQARIWLQAQIQRGNVDETAQETEETEQARRPQFAPLSVFSRSFCLSLCFTDRWMSGPAAWCLVMISPSRLKAAAEQSRAQQRREEQREEREEERHRLHLAANTLSAFYSPPRFPELSPAGLLLQACCVLFNVSQCKEGKAASGKRRVVSADSLL